MATTLKCWCSTWLPDLEVADRMLAEAKRVGYRPNRSASMLVTRKSNIIGVVLPDIINAVFPPILMGIDDALRERGYLVIVANVGADEQEQLFVINRLLGQQVDGLILATACRHDPVIKLCVDQGVPVVTVNRRDETGIASCVVSDDQVGMRLAVEHLVNLGHRHIAHIAGPDSLSTGYLRRLGFFAAIQGCGLAPSDAFVYASGGYSRECGKAALLFAECAAYSRQAGRLGCDEALARFPGATAIVAGNDLLALGCYDSLRLHGLRCPQDISVVGHNDMPFADLVNPPLTTVRIRLHEMGGAGSAADPAAPAEGRARRDGNSPEAATGGARLERPTGAQVRRDVCR